MMSSYSSSKHAPPRVLAYQVLLFIYCATAARVNKHHANSSIAVSALHNANSSSTSSSPFASISEMDNRFIEGKRVAIGVGFRGSGRIEVDVGAGIGAGKTGDVYMVTVVHASQDSGISVGQQLVLKVEARKPMEPLQDEIDIMSKLGADHGIPHSVSMVSSGLLCAPMEFAGFWSSSRARGLLMEIAPGVTLKDAHLDATMKSEITSQLHSFATAMQAKGFLHGDLSVDNIFWDPVGHEATVIDFGNAVDTKVSQTDVKKLRQLMLKKSAENEMNQFLLDLTRKNIL